MDRYRKAVFKEFENMEKSVRSQLLTHYERFFDEDNKDITRMLLKFPTWFRMRYSTKVGSNRVVFLKMIEPFQGLASHPESRAAFTGTTSHSDNVFKWMQMNFPQLDTRQFRRTQQACSYKNDIDVEYLEDGNCITSNNCTTELHNPTAIDFSFIYNSLSEICLKPKREQYDAWIQYYIKNNNREPTESIMLSNDSRSCTTPTDEIASVETVDADIDNTEVLETAKSHEAIRSDSETKTDNKQTRKPKEKLNENKKKAKKTDMKSDKKTNKETDKTTDNTNTKTLKKTKKCNQKEETGKKSFGKKLTHQLRKILPFRKAVSHTWSESKVSDRANNVL
ncbi:hypothetical protein DPMN_159142 [Dreissena polymorpha]|uniref:Uncharacterized protein n=1 Tax=Dreissena polymorpha TaxID=45954 RepID=A0A9D4EK83_DREPO|nr:hypothetical protein DPMN_159142 [Dreissena polymorpha]